MYYGGGEKTKQNNDSLSLTHDFVSLTLKGRTDGFDLKGGDATQGQQQTMYSGPRPDRTIAGTCGGHHGGVHGGAAVTLEKCQSGISNQSWGFLSDGKRIASGTRCLDIDNYRTNQGAEVWAYPCGSNSIKQNENWELKGSTLSSLQPATPFCLGAKGTTTGAGAVLDSCTASSASLIVGFTKAAGSNGTLVQKSSGLCFTVSTGGIPPAPPSTEQSCACHAESTHSTLWNHTVVLMRQSEEILAGLLMCRPTHAKTWSDYPGDWYAPCVKQSRCLGF